MFLQLDGEGSCLHSDVFIGIDLTVEIVDHCRGESLRERLSHYSQYGLHLVEVCTLLFLMAVKDIIHPMHPYEELLWCLLPRNFG